MYSLPNEWDYSVNGLCVITNTGITAIRNILAELELQGYLERSQQKNSKGQFEYLYKIYLKSRKVNPMNCTKLKRFKTALNKVNRI